MDIEGMGAAMLKGPGENTILYNIKAQAMYPASI